MSSGVKGVEKMFCLTYPFIQEGPPRCRSDVLVFRQIMQWNLWCLTNLWVGGNGAYLRPQVPITHLFQALTLIAHILTFIALTFIPLANTWGMGREAHIYFFEA